MWPRTRSPRLETGSHTCLALSQVSCLISCVDACPCCLDAKLGEAFRQIFEQRMIFMGRRRRRNVSPRERTPPPRARPNRSGPRRDVKSRCMAPASWRRNFFRATSRGWRSSGRAQREGDKRGVVPTSRERRAAWILATRRHSSRTASSHSANRPDLAPHCDQKRRRRQDPSHCPLQSVEIDGRVPHQRAR